MSARVFKFCIHDKEEKSKLNYSVSGMLYRLGCPGFEVKARINVLVPSDVINLSKSIDFTIKCFRFLGFSEAITRFDDMTKSQRTNNLIFVKMAPLCLGKGDG